ncbi:MAG: IS256 family transposase [Rivularia sp. (in: Bacteria)]|nr:IS256 family transposase [Rivularia sp. MS3]MBV6643788.1 IS256 family transposase [Cyclobacteriaceae bacterium SS2]
MEKIQQETEINLSKKQVQSIINLELEKENGLNDLFTMMVNGLMYSERKHFLEQKEDPTNKGNGYRTAFRSGIGSRLSLSIPRDRLGVFKPVVLGLLDQQEEAVKSLCFELYGKGLTTRQIEQIVENIYGSSYSKSSISRITTDFSTLVKAWLSRHLDNYYPVVYIDAIHVKVRRDQVATEAFYILLGLKEDLTREVLSIINIPQESAAGWEEVLNSIRERGVQHVGLFVFDDLTGLDSVIGKVFSKSMQQKCVLHFQRNINKHIRVNDRKVFAKQLAEVFDPDNATYTADQAVNRLKELLIRWTKTYPKLKTVAGRKDLELIFTYLHFDYRIRRMIYTTNWIERLNKAFRRTLNMRNAMPTPQSAITLIGYVAMEMGEKSYSFPITNFKFDQNF